jgi:dipeptidyl-peptidase 4
LCLNKTVQRELCTMEELEQKGENLRCIGLSRTYFLYSAPMLRRPILLATFSLISCAFAENDGLRDFNALTSKWYQVSKVPLTHEISKTSWDAADERLYFKLSETGGNKLMTLKPADGKPAEEVKNLPEWKDFRVSAKGELFLYDGLAWKKETGGKWVPGPPPEDGATKRFGHKTGWRRNAPPQAQADASISPNGQWQVEVRNDTLILKDLGKKTEKELAKGKDNDQFDASVVWAPDSSRFAIWKVHQVKPREVHYVDSSPKDQLQPKYFSLPYPKPGDEISTQAPWVFYTDTREPLAPDLSLIQNPYECDKLAWRKDSKRLTYEFVERGFGKDNVIEINSETRKQRTLIREESDTFVYVYGNHYRYDLNDGEEILWMSERDGWKHLFLMDGKTGEPKRNLTPGNWIVREVAKVDEAKREVLLKISGCYANQDPYYIHWARVNIDTGKMVALTSSDGTHDQLEISPGGKYYTTTWSRINHPPVTELRRWDDGSLVQTLAEADDSALKAGGWKTAQPFVSKDRDGKFDIYGIVVTPPDFDPKKKYPVIEYIYAGPQDSFVPKAWIPWIQPLNEVASYGFIVVQIDGKGTANRCAEFHHFCYKNLQDAGFPDRIAWMKAAQNKYPQMDLDRVGIFGGSAGGQNALGALLFHGDFYKAAAADCGCHDNRMDKIWWNEQWLDWPVGPQYEAASNVTHAKNLKGALMLTVGELDTNVDPSSTYQVINALEAADKDFEFLPMIGKNHGSGEERYAQRRRVDFFLRNLGTAKPL